MSPLELMSQWSFGGTDWLVIGLGVAVAYIVFGIAGFGTALVAGPILLMFMPLSKIIPLLVLLDLSRLRQPAAIATGCGQAGAVATAAVHGDRLHPGRGVFAQPAFGSVAVVDGAVYQRLRDLHLGGEGPAGATGGGLGGSHGHRRRFVRCVVRQWRLSICDLLEQSFAQGRRARHAKCVDQLQHVVRLSLFLIAGVYADMPLLLLAVCLLPAMALGLWCGRRLTLRMSREAFVRLVTWLVLASGIALIGRYLST